jgi:heterodisulfide reductase subunit A
VRGAHGGFQVELAIPARGVDVDACLGCGECAKACPAEAPDPFAAGLATRRAIGLAYPGCLPHVSAVDFAACLRARGEACDACVKACAFGAATLDATPRDREVTVGAIVVATGAAPGAVAPRDGVLSSYQLERMLHPDGPTAGAIRGAGGREPARVLLATTAAEEDGDVAAEEVLKLARVVRRRLPGAEVTVAGGLDRIPHLARRAAALAREGVAFAPGALAGGDVEEEGGRPALRLADAAGERLEAADLVVVHAPARPADGTAALARLLRIGTSERGFLLDRAATPFEPTATRIAGVYVAGAAAGPRTIAQSIRDGTAAAGLVLASLAAGERKPLEPLAAEVDEAPCGGCGVCASVCPFGAVVIAPGTGKARVEAVLCRGCGTCAAACPTGAASARHFTGAQIAAEISALLASGS